MGKVAPWQQPDHMCAYLRPYHGSHPTRMPGVGMAAPEKSNYSSVTILDRIVHIGHAKRWVVNVEICGSGREERH